LRASDSPPRTTEFLRRAGTHAVPALAAAVLVLAASSASARAGSAPAADSTSLDGRIVRRVTIEPHSIFDPLPQRAKTLFALADRVHVVTRERTLRSALVFRPGAPWSEAQREESERHLRALSFVVPDRIEATPVGADSVDVRVVTHDNWTTSPEFSLESGGGQRYGSASLVERNFLGLGTGLSLAYRDDVTGFSRVARIEDGGMFGSHWQGRVTYGSHSDGDTRGALLSLPFWAEGAPRSATAGWSQDRYDAELFAVGQSAATFPVRYESADLAWGAGRRGSDGAILRGLGSFEQRDHDFGPSALQPGAPAAFSGPQERLRVHRLAGEVQWWHPRYIVVRAVDQMDRDEDVDLGPSASFKAGYAPRVLGSTADEGYGRARFALGHDAGRLGFGWVRGGVQSRFRPDVREGVADVSARWVQQPRHDVAAVAAVSGIAGRNTSRDFQLTLGGIDGLRAYPVRELTGTEAWLGNAELRWVARHNVLQLVSVGGAAFWDSGRTWGPGAETQWHHDAGFGLRLSLPHSALNAIARFDVAWPVLTPGEERRGPAFSFGSGQEF